MERRPHHDINKQKASALFSRYLLNPHPLPSLPENKKSNITTGIDNLCNLINELNEKWFSFSTDLSNHELGVDVYKKAMAPLESRYFDISKNLPHELQPVLQAEHDFYFRELEFMTENTKDTMSLLSGFYLNFLKLLEVTITRLSLIYNDHEPSYRHSS